jgi:serine/threonine-protein phosphatase 2A regulatory subunit B
MSALQRPFFLALATDRCFMRSYMITGSYNNMFCLLDRATGEHSWLEATKTPRKAPSKTSLLSPKKLIGRRNKKAEEINVETLDFEKKVLYSAFHPRENVLAVAAANLLYIFNKSTAQP